MISLGPWNQNLRFLSTPRIFGFWYSKRTVEYHTHNLFDDSLHRDLYSLNFLLASNQRNGDARATWALFLCMYRSRRDLNAYTFTPVLKACSVLPSSDRGKQVHTLMIKMGTDSGIITQTALMDMYSKYGLLGDSVKIFDEMELKDVVTWNALLSSFLRHGLAGQALSVFQAMRREGVEYSEFTLCSLLKACAALKAFKLGKQVHGLVTVMGRDLLFLSTAMIDFYSNLGYVSEAIQVFSSVDCGKDDVMRNSMIAGCVQNKKYVEAFSIMSTMRPNVYALTSALAACSRNSDLWIGKQIHCVAIRFGFISDTQMCNVLLDMYAKCGKVLNARLLFDRMDCKDVISWTSMIDAYGSHGHGVEAFELFKRMGDEESGVCPNSVTFLAVLSACGHCGRVELGRECFNLAQEKYGLVPGPEHLVCFIDILGRAGEISEAWSLFDNMVKQGLRPTAEVWATLLNACSLNLDVSRGEFAAKCLFQLEPNKPANYVLLSNFYASVGRWNHVDELRAIMWERGMVKEAGSSLITVPHSQQNGTGPTKLQ